MLMMKDEVGDEVVDTNGGGYRSVIILYIKNYKVYSVSLTSLSGKFIRYPCAINWNSILQFYQKF